MQIRIEMAANKRESKIFVDECQVRHGVMDFDFDLSDGIPVVMLKIWAEGLVVTGENADIVVLTKDQILNSKRFRRSLRKNLIFCVRKLFRWIRASGRWTQDTWRQQHPNNHKLFKIYR